MVKTLEQKRALFAMKAIKNGNAEYYRHVRKMPAMILNNGLGQALAFLLADDEGKKKEPSYLLYQDLSKWLCENNHNTSKLPPEQAPCCVYFGKDDLLDALMKGNRFQYLQAQNEALKLLVWLKKFADAMPTGEE